MRTLTASSASLPLPGIQQAREELANAWTHGVGAAAALAGGAVLVTLTAIFGDGW